jgi:2'-5' RNA ligase
VQTKGTDNAPQPAADAEDTSTTAPEEPAQQQPKRLFVALLPDDACRQALIATQRQAAPGLARARFTAPENLHLTLAFLGGCDAAAEHTARRAVAAAARRMACTPGGAAPLALRLGPVGAFARRRGGSVLWRGVGTGEGPAEPVEPRDEGGTGAAQVARLLTLHRLLCAALAAEGLPLEARFTPHLTLARGVRLEKPIAPPPASGQAAAQARQRDAARARALDAFCHKLSTTAPAGMLACTALSLMWSHRAEPEHTLVYTEIARADWTGTHSDRPCR